MGRNLVIVESPAKARTINKLLGSDYVVKASMGHVRDLPEKKLGVDIDNGFEPQYVPIDSRQKVIKELIDDAKQADAIYLAPDPDREGEAIAWHLKHVLEGQVDDERFFRVTYNEITEPAIREAFQHPSRINMHRVDAQQARRVLDRLVGYQVSPLLWRRIRGSRSAGRVQSAALRLVCERERRIRDFKPEEYWILGAKVRKEVEPKDPFLVRLARIDDEKADVRDEKQAGGILEELARRRMVVAKIIEREVNRRPQPAFITSTLQQSASSVHGFAPSRTMRLAQTLYEGVDFGEGPIGLITYMRTDSVAVSKEAQQACREYVSQAYGDAFIPEKPNLYKSRSSAQEAHEAIRPTDVTRTPASLAQTLKADELKLYRLIWQRFVASQMSPARIAQRTVEIEARPDQGGGTARSFLFRATTSDVVFPGFMTVTGQDRKKTAPPSEGAEESDEVAAIPPLSQGEPLDCLDWLKEQKFTQPPPRFTEAALVKALEENGVGRPSTYAQMLSTIIDRDYVVKEKRALAPTELGLKVNDFLVANLSDLFNVGFTAQMEELLDGIERGEVEWTGMLKEFYGSFQTWLEKSKEPAADPVLVDALLHELDPVKSWAPPAKRGKRTYSDEKFVASVRDQLDEGKKAVTGRQVEALAKLIGKYHNQLPAEVANRMKERGLDETYQLASRPQEPPRDTTIRKLELLQAVQFDEPRTVGKRTYDDGKFAASLREQVSGGKRLSENQLRYLNQLVAKYRDQIPSYEEVTKDLDLVSEEETPDVESGPILDLLAQVDAWDPPVQRGKREWDDKKFYDSLRKQFQAKKSLSVKQRASLKKMAARYGDQIPNYEEAALALGLPPKKTRKKKTGNGTSPGENTALAAADG